MATEFPTGIVTLAFTDIEGSSALWERMQDRFRPVLDRHNDLLRQLLQRWDGYEVKTQGDSFMVAFRRATDAVEWAVDVQRTLAAQEWPDEMGELLVRIGLHTGEPFVGYDPAGNPDYFGPMVNRAARIAAAGHGGQILLSGAMHDVLQGALTTDIQLIDLGQHRLRGLEQAETLFEVHHPDLPPRHFPPLRTLDVLPHNLPVHLTTFVGREKELAELAELLTKPETRLLTLTGLGGSGKTRLAHQVALDGAGRFPDGVWWVNLAEVSEPETVIPQIAAAVRLPLLPQRDPREQLGEFLRERSLLLILDDFDRVVGASLGIADLLRAAPRVQCLVTSRIALRLRGEQVYPLPPLPAPPASVTPEQLLRFDSVALFVERAQAARPDFAVTPGNAPHLAGVCRQLEGLPLAIELAAAQVADMSVTEVIESLQSRLDALWGESPDLPERHRTLRATMDWSYGLLGAAEQKALAQFSIFAGGWFRNSAQAVCGPEGLAALRTLHRHSLVQTTEWPDGRTRYFLLEMVREYARAKLDEQPDLAREVAQRHAQHFLDFAAPRTARIRTRDEAPALEELSREVDNLRAALGWSQGNQEGELCARLSLALYQVLYRRGFWAEAEQCLQVGWTATEGLEGDARGWQAALGHHLASLAQDRGNLAEARARAEASRALRQELNDPPGLAESLNLLGLIALEEGDSDAAQTHFEEALRLLAADDHTQQGMVLHNLALLARRRGTVEEAKRLYQESLGHRRTAGDVRGEAETLGNLGFLAHIANDLAEARRLYDASLALRRDLRDRYGIAVMLNNLGELAEAEGDLPTAVALFVHAERLFHDLQSADERTPAEHLQRLTDQWAPDRLAEARQAAEGTTWEEILKK
jgi:predicted ATPase/class 3 adenylate cyclase